MSACYPFMKLNIISNNGKWILQNHTYTNIQRKNSLMRYIIWSGPTRIGFHGVRIFPYLPHLLGMLLLMVLVSRALHWLLRFLKQPLIVCQLLTGVLIISFLPKPSDEMPNHNGGTLLNPPNRRIDHVIGSVGILFNLFIAGVKLQPKMFWQFKSRKPLIIGFTSLLIPMAVGFIIYFLKKDQLALLDINPDRYIFLCMYALSGTYPVALYEILEELRLINSELGRLALSSSMIQCSFGWTCLFIFTAIRQGQKGFLQGAIALMSVLLIAAFLVLVFYPYAQWVVRTTPLCGRVKGVHIMVITFVVFMMGLLSDMSGSTTYADGAMITGLVIPDGPPLGTALIERVEVVASELLLPLVFMHEGYYADLIAAKEELSVSLWIGLLVLVTFVVRILANVAAALYLRMSLKNGLLLGFIMNFRGLVDMLFFIRLANTQLMGRTTFGVLVFASIIVTAICVPIVSIYYKPLAAREQIWLRAVERVQNHAEINVMVCFYDDKPVQPLLEFHESLSFALETNNSTCLYSLHLVEKQGRAASSLTCHRNKKGHISTAQMDPVHNHFLNFEQAKRSSGVNVIPFTSVAPLNSMHHDICSLILEKNISLVIVPYPKKNSIADLEASAATHNLVPLVLQNAPCSVGIMVYHGTTRIIDHSYWQYHVCVLFWGGPDDRESISIASRMARHPGVYLTVIRFLTSESTKDENHDNTDKKLSDDDDDDDNTDKKLSDDQLIVELQVENAGNNRVTVSEVSVSNVNQVISAIQAIGDDKYDLLIAGRKQKKLSLLGDGLTNWTETPELGVLGDLLSTDISGIANVLIVQQHIVTQKLQRSNCYI